MQNEPFAGRSSVELIAPMPGAVLGRVKCEAWEVFVRHAQVPGCEAYYLSSTNTTLLRVVCTCRGQDEVVHWHLLRYQGLCTASTF